METEQEKTWRYLKRVSFGQLISNIRGVGHHATLDVLHKSGWTEGEFLAEVSKLRATNLPAACAALIQMYGKSGVARL